ncbi:MAG: VOC family protein [Pseudomonadota bacterium]|nr:VOC family protein [Pseudomonadota bacterium]
MAIVGTDHTVMLVQDIEAGITTYRDHLGLELSHQVEHTEAGISQAFFALADGTFLELIAPAGDNSRFDQVLNDNGEGYTCWRWRWTTWMRVLPRCSSNRCN